MSHKKPSKSESDLVVTAQLPPGVAAVLAEQEALQDELPGGLPVFEMIAGAEKGEHGSIVCEALGFRTRRPMTAYILGFRRSRSMFPPQYNEGDKLLCASEYSLEPVSAETAIQAQIMNPQAGPCKSCRYQSFGWARLQDLSSPPCSLNVALLVAVEVSEHSRVLGLLRCKRTSYGAAMRILKATKFHAGDYRRCPTKWRVTTGASGKVRYGIWLASVDEPGLEKVQALGSGYPWASWFSVEQISDAFAQLVRPYYDRPPEEISEEWMSDDDIPF